MQLVPRIDERELRRVLTKAADALFVLDPDGRILEVNTQASYTLGYSIEDLAKLSLRDIDADFDSAKLRKLVEDGEPADGAVLEHRLRRKDGTYLPCEVSIGAVHLEDRTSVILFAARNVAERRELERRLRDALLRAEQSDRMKSVFLSTINHEVRSPLNVIVGYGALVADMITGDDKLDKLEILGAIERATARLLNCIHSILDLSRIQSEDFTARLEPVDVGAVLLKRLQQFHRDAERKGIALRWEIEEKGRLLRFDRYCLSEAIAKLLDNAVKFTERGEITVKLHRDDEGCLRLDVQDTGVGIAEDYLPRLFHAFSQEDSGMNRRFEGTGIGLLLAKSFLELNGSTIAVESEKGKGSLFSVHFPRDIELAGELRERTGARRGPARGSGLRRAQR